ncbi:hypothetical protein RI845_04715 [Thalassotalea nanhaiensis]|uniref:DUF4295 domain-containing protein n=1 Tax=Thalassotalea nanhaiensis TaxID=3065648 RepID=A0ABY9TL62_9GAMM|nr:hypothetical protein RI845_04715 [Colwelliaceae bacterium SQ345]
MNFLKFLSAITGLKKQQPNNKVQVDINYVQSHAKPGSFFGQTMDTTEKDCESSESNVNN